MRTYASNLRINVHAMSESDWVAYIKNLKARAAGEPAQAYLPPDKEPKPPYIQYPMPPK